MDENKTAILFVLDRSGSMRPLKEDVMGGFDTLIKEQAAEEGEATLTLVQFDDKYQVDYKDVPLSEVPPLVFEPRGLTAYYDALGRGMVELGETLSALPEEERPGKVIVVVMTDGEENSSQEWNHEMLKAKVEEQKNKYSWEFVFAAANLDAEAVGASLGIANNANFVASSVGTRSVIRDMSKGLSLYRSNGKYEVPPTGTGRVSSSKPNIGGTPKADSSN